MLSKKKINWLTVPIPKMLSYNVKEREMQQACRKMKINLNQPDPLNLENYLSPTSSKLIVILQERININC